MNKLYKFAAVVLCTAFLTISCEEDAVLPVYSPSPNALTSQSEITTLLQSIQAGEYECVSINYPITMVTNLASYQNATETIIDDEAEMLQFFSNLTATDVYSIQYPLTISGFDSSGEGQTITINSNTEFMTLLQSEIAQCMAYYNCDTANTVFQQAYNAVKAEPGVVEEMTMDLFTHEYTFSISEGGSICSIGYMGEEADIPYTIQLVNASGTVLYEGIHTFSATEMEYVSIPFVDIVAGENYTIRRSIESYAVGSGIGTMLTGAADQLPTTTGIITIHESKFYGGGGTPDPDFGRIPKIDFVFKPL
ncbi:MAG: hypothetical protein EOO45_09160 [Flavobacterium sp.]|nr:MAG: hypothetical protein EOO45_09160 [Flavobacterium sp.]